MSWKYECDDINGILKVHVFPTNEAYDLLRYLKQEGFFSLSDYDYAILEHDSEEAPLVLLSSRGHAKYPKILVDAGYIGDHSYQIKPNQKEWNFNQDFSASYTIDILELFGFLLTKEMKNVLTDLHHLGKHYYVHITKYDKMAWHTPYGEASIPFR